MDRELKIKQLRSIINQQLLPLIDNDYIYLDLPYHSNIGDTLIWEGTLEFLKQIPQKCLYTSSYETYIPQPINSNTIIFLHGGGNWGDLYPKHHEFRKRIIKEYPHNRIIILPQTIYYPNTEALEKDSFFFNQHPNVIICTRDNASYQLLKTHFQKNLILLIPDMAFFLSLPNVKTKKNGQILFLKRKDKELSSHTHIPTTLNVDTHDWPSMENDYWKIRIVNILFGILKTIIAPFNSQLSKRIKDFKYNYFIRKHYIKIGTTFIDKYDTVYTTRLHGMILSILLDKYIYIMDNSYGKNFSFYHTWLKDLDSVHLLESNI